MTELIHEEVTETQMQLAQKIKDTFCGASASKVSVFDSDCSARDGDIVLAVNYEGHLHPRLLRFGVVSAAPWFDYYIRTMSFYNRPDHHYPDASCQSLAFTSPKIIVNYTRYFSSRRSVRIIIKAYRKYKAIMVVLKLAFVCRLPASDLVSAVHQIF